MTAFLAVLVGPLRAQFIAEGGERPTIQRRVLTVEPFFIIYPQGHDSLAQAVARYAARYRRTSKFNQTSNRRFPIVMRSFTPIVNGMVAWVPSRMELYSMTANDQAYPNRWLNHLVSHEMRHYAQMNALSEGPFRWLRYLIGEQSAALAAFFTPLWFFEGDAIYHESRATGYGRAQSAVSYQQFRAELLTGNRLSYDQYINRSLRYQTPNHYEFGTLLVEHGVNAYGEDFWSRVIAKSRWQSFGLFPFHFGIKAITGNSRHQLFNHAMQILDSTYRANILFHEEIIPVVRTDWHDERYPHRISKNRWHILWKRSLSRRLACYALPRDAKEVKVIEPINLYSKVKYHDTLAIWSEIHAHPIWRLTHQAEIRVINLLNGKTIASTKHGSYLSPCFIEHTGQMAGIRINSYGKYDIAILPLTPNASPVDSISLPTIYELREMCYNPQDSCLIVRTANDNGMHIVRVNLKTKEFIPLLSNQMIDGSGIAANGKGLFFSASYKFARRAFFIPFDKIATTSTPYELLHIPSHGIEDITLINEDSIAYASYTINGYRIKHIANPNTIAIDSLDANANPFTRTINTFSIQYNQDTIGKGKPYSKIRNAVRIHSWLPSYSLPSLKWDYLTKSDIGITFMSQNDLGTLSLVGSLFNKETWGASLTTNYTGFWPHIALNVLWGGTHRLGERKRKRWDSLSERIEGKLALEMPIISYLIDAPLTVIPSVTLSADNDRLMRYRKGKQRFGNVESTIGLRVAWHTPPAPRDLNPRWGITLSIGTGSPILHTPRLIPWYGLATTIYLPGVASNHSFRLKGFVLGQWNRQDILPHRLPILGRLNNAPTNLRIGMELQAGIIEYSAPIAYPDLNLSSWLYIKRLYGTIGMQYASIKQLNRQRSLIRTVHFELLTNIIPFRTHYEFTLGARGTISPFKDRLGKSQNDFWNIEAIIDIQLPPRGN